MFKFMKVAFALFLVGAMATTAWLAGCGPTPVPTATPLPKATTPAATPTPSIPKGGTIVEGTFADAKILNPFLSTDTASSNVHTKIFRPLVRLDPKTGEAIPDLAEKWDVSPDGLTYTFYLRKDVVWSDGTPFTAKDVKATLESIMDPKTKTVRKNLYENVKGAKDKAAGKVTEVEGFKVVDDKTFKVEMAEVYCPFLVGSMTMGIIPAKVIEASKDINTDDFNMKPTVGTGPFLFKEWVKDDHVTLVANDKYYMGRPNVDSWTMKVVKDATVVMAQLKTGEVDIGTIEPKDLEEMEKTPGVTIHKYFALGYTYLGYNLARDIFKDKRVRQALTYALNRQQFIDKVLYKQGDPIAGPVPPISWQVDKSLSL